jgi:hypothetical protein
LRRTMNRLRQIDSITGAFARIFIAGFTRRS